jgi:hypothetical protein
MSSPTIVKEEELDTTYMKKAFRGGNRFGLEIDSTMI